eukprot:CAMPEP_0118700450 /NCGR_PEP_ID=MMETSP0800-20121206/16583_1 /TAXON_ID=210618 ORGANISM="Striatella unipunctata, Strain CCMP2910" /NCGR_SAMPLE_ID=MMETSP0800 /ASSEMBLY_ACC=CAM_ASM_000638 /LENGTH=92 /DNA_ID=CAMNT_0006601023 /DNA_START=22 /DNA_END=297 /DNA_ORIENTATION=+
MTFVYEGKGGQKAQAKNKSATPEWNKRHVRNKHVQFNGVWHGGITKKNYAKFILMIGKSVVRKSSINNNNNNKSSTSTNTHTHMQCFLDDDW